MSLVTLVLTDPNGVATRWVPIYRMVLAWSVRSGDLKVWGPLCLN